MFNATDRAFEVLLYSLVLCLFAYMLSGCNNTVTTPSTCLRIQELEKQAAVLERYAEHQRLLPGVFPANMWRSTLSTSQTYRSTIASLRLSLDAPCPT